MPCSAVASPNAEDCSRCGKNAPLVAALLNLLLAVFLVFIGLFSGSRAILGSALYSFKDFITALAVFIGIRVSEKPADGTHHYGHGKIEFVSMLFIGVAIFVASLFLFFHSVRDVWAAWQGQFEVPKLIALCGGCISVIANYKLYKYLFCVGTRQNHPAILAAARHHHADASASVFVVLAIIGANMGLLFLDPLVAVLETLDLMRLSGGMLKDGLNGVLDGSVQGRSIRSEVEEIARLVPGVRKIGDVGVRQFGQERWIDITIKVDHDKSASEGYLIGQHVKESIVKAVAYIANVSVTIEPYVP
jgi:cation diffusion facilitator family transporter